VKSKANFIICVSFIFSVSEHRLMLNCVWLITLALRVKIYKPNGKEVEKNQFLFVCQPYYCNILPTTVAD